MVKRVNLILILSIFNLLSSCKEVTQTAKEQTQMQKVIAIHDEVMPKMGTINTLIVELKSTPDSINGDQLAAIKKLEASHNAMMDWMSTFSTRFTTEEIINQKALSEEKQQWLDEEELKVRTLKKQINSSIKSAEKILEKNH